MAKIEPQVKMREQSVSERLKNFSEVPLGYNEAEAVREAKRCLQCSTAPCVKGCPVSINIPAFIRLIGERKFLEAARLIKESNSLPAICGRVCPQEDQCEKSCLLHKQDKAIAIGYLERFVSDYERAKKKIYVPRIKTGKKGKIAIIGSGPSGLTCAGELRKLGYQVTIFEGLHQGGGVLSYGIPAFRLPKEIVRQEIDYVRELGVEIKYNMVIGKIYTVDELLKQSFSAVYIATGAGYPSFMDIPGENLNYIYSSNEFLTRINLMKAYTFPQYDTPIKSGRKVAVIGGGNTAMDAARSALRLGPEKVYLVYRRSSEEMPARVEEIHRAKEEGIEFHLLTLPVEFLGDKQGNVRGMRCQKMKLGEKDKSARRKPIPIPGSEFEIEVNSVVVAIGTRANPLVPQTTNALKLNKRGYIMVDETGQTSRPEIFAGGDIVSGSATLIKAMGAARTAAGAIDKYLEEKNI